MLLYKLCDKAHYANEKKENEDQDLFERNDPFRSIAGSSWRHGVKRYL